METQNKIGWDNFIKGWICIKRKCAPHMFKEAMPKRCGPLKLLLPCGMYVVSSGMQGTLISTQRWQQQVLPQ
eukprot:7155248-Ditylum_brightwellii.AAC.1